MDIPITVTLSGTGSGSVTSSKAGVGGNRIDCSNSGNSGAPPTGICSEEFLQSGKVELTAMADVHPALFTGWTGSSPGSTCNSGTKNPCSFTVASPTTVNAAFRFPPDPPMATTEGSTPGSTYYLFSLAGQVNPEGEKVESCRFEYDTRAYEVGEAGHGSSVPCATVLGEGSADEPVEASTEPLEPNTTYHYRLVASNPGGSGTGEERTFSTGSAPPDSCPNAAFRAAQGIAALLLPDCMALEMVSPPQKKSQAAKEAAISATGDRIRFNSLAALAGTPSNLSLNGDPYVATRTPSGWITEPTTQSVGIFVKGWSGYAEASSFTPDLSRWFQLGASVSQYQAGIARAFAGGLGGLFEPLSPLLVPLMGGERKHVEQSTFQGASADHSRLYFIPGPGGDASTAYLSGDPAPAGAEGADHNTYVARLDAEGQPTLELLTRDRNDKVWGGNCGSRLGGIGPIVGTGLLAKNGERNQGAVSANGTRVYFSTRPTQPVGASCSIVNKLRILERLESDKGPWIGPLFSSECARVSPPCSSADGDDLFQGASVDGTKVYFTTNRQLVDGDLDGSSAECSISAAVAGCDLYLYDSTLPLGERLVQVSAGEELGAGVHEAGKEAKVYNAITAISSDGSHVYFVAQGVLTDDANPIGATATAGQPNLYLYERNEDHPAGRIAFVGTLLPSESNTGGAGLWGGRGTFRNQAYPVPVMGKDAEGQEVGGDGHVLLFQSKSALSADDTDGSRLDVFRYDADGEELECISCIGPSDSEPFDVTSRGLARMATVLGTDFAEEGRWVSEDGLSVILRTAEGLVPGDVNRVLDSYLWRDGQFFRLPGTADSSGAANGLNDFPVLSHDGSEVAFQTFSPLLPQDIDTAKDVYVARVGGGFPNPPQALESCQPDESLPGSHCQGSAPAAPAQTEGLTGTIREGNPPPKAQRSCPKGKRKVRRGGKVRCANRKQRRRHAKNAKRRNRTRHAAVDGKTK